MGKRKRVTEEDILADLRAGLGTGTGKSYQPWHRIQFFSSRGNSHRIWSSKTQRVHHLFSNIERAIFLKAEHGDHFVDVLEQRPLEREQTRAIADRLGIKHPRYPGTKVDCVMTLDAVVGRRDVNGDIIWSAYDGKDTAKLQDPRILEWLSIHRAYCQLKGWQYAIVTEETIPRMVVRNLEWIRKGMRLPKERVKVGGLFDELPLLMHREILKARPSLPVNRYCAGFDQRQRLPLGAGLRVIQILLHRHALTCDLANGPVHMEPVASLIPANLPQD